jgi:hypothetical protein
MSQNAGATGAGGLLMGYRSGLTAALPEAVALAEEVKADRPPTVAADRGHEIADGEK